MKVNEEKNQANESDKSLSPTHGQGLAEYTPLSWMLEPRRSHSMLIGGTGITEPHYYIDNQEVSKDEYEASERAQNAADSASRREKKFDLAEDAFTYAATLQDGVVLDWGRCYVAMERTGLKVGFAIEPYEQPIITPQDLLVRSGPSYILVRRDPVGSGFGGCCTDFTDDSKSWSEAECEVIDDGTGRYKKGQRLKVRISPNMGARASVGRNWRMKLLRPEDVVFALPLNEPARETDTQHFG